MAASVESNSLTSIDSNEESITQEQFHTSEENIWRLLQESEAETRVLTLLPSLDPEAPIHVELEIVSLRDESLRYECISYCWGTPVIMSEIFLFNKPFACPANLVAALRSLRFLSERRTLWADAICINQTKEGLGERSEQVQHMGAIFSIATQVISWVGEADPWTALLFNLLKEIDARGENLLEYAAAGHPGAKDDPVLFATIVKLLWMPYFTRLWMAQELSLARHVEIRWGSESIPLEAFTQSIMKVGHAENLYRKANMVVGPKRTDPLLNVFQYTSLYTPFLLFRQSGPTADAIAISRRLNCYDPRDKVYGVLALTFLKIDVDYRKETEYVYREAAIARIVTSKSLDVFFYAWDPKIFGKASLGSSWVTNWEVTDLDLLLQHTLVRSTAENFSASGTLKPKIHAIPSSRACYLQAIRVDVLAKTGEAWLGPHFEQKDWPSLVQQHARHWKKFLDTADDVWWRVMLYDLFRIGNNNGKTERRLESSDYTQFEHEKLISMETVDPKEMWAILGHIRQPLNMKPCITASGLRGQIPAAAEPGDVVFVLLGSELPWILRLHTEEGEEGFKLVGPCYVNGIMDGETVAQAAESLVQIKLY